MPEIKLFIPGPTYVRPEIYKAMSKQMIGHRSQSFMDLYVEIQKKLQKLFYTKNPVYISTSSGTLLMEAAVRNLVSKSEKCLHLSFGAFGKQWHDIAKSCGRDATLVHKTDGDGYSIDQIKNEMSKNDYSSLFMTHNETTSGIMLRNIEKISAFLKKEFPDVLFLLDTVSSMAGTKIDCDKIGADVVLTSSQKAFALPPGLSFMTLSQRAMEKAKKVEDRGYYFNFEQFQKYHEKNQTITTPAISLIYGLNQQLDDIFKEGIDNRFNRHKNMAKLVIDWAESNFEVFAYPEYRSDTVTVIKNTKNINVSELNKELKKRGVEIANGYKEFKDITFRIAHMGDLTVEDVKGLLGNINEILNL